MDVIFAPYFTAHRDPQRKKKQYVPDDFEKIKNWKSDIELLELDGVIFHDQCSEKWTGKHSSEHIKFWKTPPLTRSCNDYRFLAYLATLRFSEVIDKMYEQEDEGSFVIMTDLFDVRITENPFDFMRTRPKRKIFATAAISQPAMITKANYKIVYGERVPDDRPFILGCVLGGQIPDIIKLLQEMKKDFDRVSTRHNVNQVVINRNVWKLFDRDEVYLGTPFAHDVKKHTQNHQACIYHECLR